MVDVGKENAADSDYNATGQSRATHQLAGTTGLMAQRRMTMTDDKKKPDDEAPKAQAEDAKPSENLSDDELGKAAGGVPCQSGS